MYTVYGRPNCGYCDRAKALLEEKSLAFEYHDVMADLEQRQALLEKLPDVKLLPQIFLNGEHVGGFTELRQSLTA